MASGSGCVPAPGVRSSRPVVARVERSWLPELGRSVRFMLPAPARMRAGDDFRRTMRHGRRTATRSVVLHLHHTDVPSISVGFVVGKGIGPAVTRNRVKRRLRHLMARRMDVLAMGSSMVVRALPVSARQSSAELADALDDALRQALDGHQ